MAQIYICIPYPKLPILCAEKNVYDGSSSLHYELFSSFQTNYFGYKCTEIVFLVSLGMSLFLVRYEVYRSSFFARRELAPSSFPAWLKIRSHIIFDAVGVFSMQCIELINPFFLGTGSVSSGSARSVSTQRSELEDSISSSNSFPNSPATATSSTALPLKGRSPVSVNGVALQRQRQRDIYRTDLLSLSGWKAFLIKLQISISIVFFGF